MRTSAEWREYYAKNAATLPAIPWEVGGDLTDDERRLIAPSIQGFQAGESSEGRHLLRYAREYAGKSGDHDYVAAIKLFIAEEQRHARDLARFLRLNNIPLVKSSFPDRIFRRLRHTFGGLEISIAVLITAEIIAKVYYGALGVATGSIVLQTLCDQILRDEIQHVEFQAEQLGKLRRSRGEFFGRITMGLQRFLFWGTCLVVWQYHKEALRQGELDFVQFWSACWTELDHAFDISNGVIVELAAEQCSDTDFSRPPCRS